MSRIDYAIPSQAYELIRDRIGEILTDEVANQIDLSYDVDLNAVVLIEDRDPIDKVQLNAIVVSLATGQYSNKNQGSSVDGGYLYFIDIYTNAKERFNKSGSYRAATIAHKLSRYVRCILEHQEYKTLGYQPGFVMRTGFVEFNIRDVSPSTDSLSTYMIRMVFKVDANEITNAKVPNLIEGYDTRVDVIYQYEGNTDTDESCECEMNADFTVSNSTIIQGQSVQLFDQTNNNPTDWQYTLINGATELRSWLQNPTFTLNALGTYNVKLMAGKDGAGDVVLKDSIITVVAPPFEPEAIALFSRMALIDEDPSNTRKMLINDWFINVKNALGLSLGSSNIATIGDVKYMMAAHGEGSAKLNWIKDAHNITPVNAPVYQIDRGWTGNGIDQHLKTNYNLAINASAVSLNDLYCSVYSRTQSTIPKYDFGASEGGVSITMDINEGGIFYGICLASTELSTPNGSSLGMHGLLRSNSSKFYIGIRGVYTEITNASIRLPNSEILLNARSVDGVAFNRSTRQLSSANIFKASAKAAVEAADIIFLTAIGAQV